MSTDASDAEPDGAAEELTRPTSRWRWLVFPLALLAFAAGVAIAPRSSDAERAPSEQSVEVGFARDMRVHHLQALTMSGFAMREASDPSVRAAALDVFASQTGQVGMMSGWLSDWGRPLVGDGPRMAWMAGPAHGSTHDAAAAAPQAHALLPDGRMPGMATPEEMASLRAATGVEVDRQFLSLLITHHRGGLAMARDAAERSKRPAVQLLASRIFQSQSSEVANLIADLVRLGGTPPPESDVFS